MNLYAHQQRFIDKNPDRALLVWETGTGKTVAGCLWLQKRKDRRRLVVCPKAIIKKWEADIKKWKVEGKVEVISRDDIKKVDLFPYRAIILDEAQDFASPLFDKSRSQRSTVLYNHIKQHPDTHVLELTATPVRSTPFNIHTLACYLGIFWPLKNFRSEFFYFTDLFGHFHWEKKTDWRINIRSYVESISDIVLMSECVDVPKQEEEVIKIEWTKKQEEALSKEYLEPIQKWYKRHRAEQSESKYKVLENIIDGYRKVIVVCFYLDQITDYAKRISKERQVFVLTGSTKDQESVIKQAQAADDCIFIVQSSLGSGFDADKFSVMVFASLAFSYVAMVQMKGRIKRIHNLHENKYYYLLGGKADQAVYESLEKGKDFDPLTYLKGKKRDEDKLDF